MDTNQALALLRDYDDSVQEVVYSRLVHDADHTGPVRDCVTCLLASARRDVLREQIADGLAL